MKALLIIQLIIEYNFATNQLIIRNRLETCHYGSAIVSLNSLGHCIIIYCNGHMIIVNKTANICI